jgi:uncharacterized protein YndB with AHSA1/START domain
MTADVSVAEVRRRFDVPPEKVFAAFAEPRLVSRWLTPSPDTRLSVLHFDFRVGGAYRFAYHVPGGERPVFVTGSYRIIEPSSIIVFSWTIEPPDEHAGVESEVTVEILRTNEGAELIIRHAKLTQASAVERHAQGWRGALDRLKSVLDGKGAER